MYCAIHYYFLFHVYLKTCIVGVVCHDPMMRTLQQSRRNQEVTAKIAARAKVRAGPRPLSLSLSLTHKHSSSPCQPLGLHTRPVTAVSSLD